MPIILVAHLLFASAYAGFQWTVQVVVYPQFRLVPKPAFPEYERGHQRRISFVVGPLFGGLTLSTLGLFAVPAGAVWGRWVAIALLGVILGATAFVAVPLHRRLAAGFDDAAFAALLRVDLVRALAAAADAAVAVVLLL